MPHRILPGTRILEFDIDGIDIGDVFAAGRFSLFQKRMQVRPRRRLLALHVADRIRKQEEVSSLGHSQSEGLAVQRRVTASRDS